MCLLNSPGNSKEECVGICSRLPYDAGKWVICENAAGAKYHLLIVQASLPAPSEKNACGAFQHVME